MKPSLFIGSSTESLQVAYALQENLEHSAEVTVWTQGIFELSKYTLDSLVDALDVADFGAFIFTPDDISTIKGTEKASVRDNVIFELGLFIGGLGRERNFIVLPRGYEESLHFPTDLLGLTPALYDATRQDENMLAALGPASSKIGKVLAKLGKIKPMVIDVEPKPRVEDIGEYSEEDKKAVLASWMGSRPRSDNSKVIHFAAVDRELGLEHGTTKKYIKDIASRWRYVVEHEGEQTILFRQETPQIRRRSSLW